uniref:Uncharacterized protein n=1 Tax=Rhizophora mucronata TaxID=61149 RepID=A0A2P2MIU7_RHIMU
MNLASTGNVRLAGFRLPKKFEDGSLHFLYPDFCFCSEAKKGK